MSNTSGLASLSQRDRHLQKLNKRRDDECEQLHKARYIIVCESAIPSTNSWDQLIRALRSTEPCIRHLSMKCIESCLKTGSGESGMSQPMRRDMTHLMMDILRNDVEERNRSLAGLVLGQIVCCYGANLPSLTKDICHACIQHLIHLQSQISQLTVHRPGYNQARLHSIRVLDTILQVLPI